MTLARDFYFYDFLADLSDINRWLSFGRVFLNYTLSSFGRNRSGHSLFLNSNAPLGPNYTTISK